MLVHENFYAFRKKSEYVHHFAIPKSHNHKKIIKGGLNLSGDIDNTNLSKI